MAEYISKQRAKDLMGCCLASAKANLKVETSIFKKAEFESIIKTIESMIDVVGAVEAADVQPVVYTHKTINVGRRSYCSNCGKLAIMEDFCSKCGAKVKDGDTE